MTPSQNDILCEWAAKILTGHAAVIACDQNAAEQQKQKIQKAIACGECLIEAKKLAVHGKWGDWLRDNCKGVCEKTAQNYMRLCNANSQHVADLSKATTLRQAYVAAGIIAKKEHPEPSDFTKAKGLTKKLWELLNVTTDPERMANQIQPLLAWYQDFAAQKQRREASLNDGFDANEKKPAEESITDFECNACGETFADDTEAVSLYECAECGSLFTRETSANDNHQCQECNKFGAKISDCGCPSCNEGELEKVGDDEIALAE